MGYFIAMQGEYYEGDRLHHLDLEVPRRPSPDHTWDGAQWVAPGPVALLDTRAAAHVDNIDRLQFAHLFDLENRVRVLEGKAVITVAQYRQALINRWKTLQN